MVESAAKQNKYHIHISSKHKLMDLKLKEVWEYRDLIWLFTKQRFTVYYKQTILGPAWLLLSPFITCLIYVFVFGGIAGISTDGVPQLLFYMSGTAIWNYFSASLSKNANAFTTNAGLFGKVYFPRLTMPLSNVISSVIEFGIQFLLVAAFLIYYLCKGEVSPNWGYLVFVPLVLIHLGLMGMGFGIIISSMTTKYRDLSILVGFGVSIWMYATPVVYPLSVLEYGWMKTIVSLNPVTAPIELYRYALLGRGTLDFMSLGVSVAMTFVVLIVGIMIFNKVERSFMDTV